MLAAIPVHRPRDEPDDWDGREDCAAAGADAGADAGAEAGADDRTDGEGAEAGADIVPRLSTPRWLDWRAS